MRRRFAALLLCVLIGAGSIGAEARPIYADPPAAGTETEPEEEAEVGTSSESTEGIVSESQTDGEEGESQGVENPSNQGENPADGTNQEDKEDESIQVVAEDTDEEAVDEETIEVISESEEELAEAGADKKEVKVDARTQKIQGFVKNLYLNFLGRKPDKGGLNNWTEWLKSGKCTAVDAVYGFIFSEEYKTKKQSNTDYVSGMYRAILGREPDQGGLNTWVGWLDKGCTKELLFYGFMMSDEFNTFCNSLSIKRGSYKSAKVVDQNMNVTAFVSRMYTKCLGRSFDRKGLTGWTGELLSGARSGTDIVRGFFFSSEFKNANLGNEEFLRRCYRTLFDREPDQSGWNTWMTYLNQGRSREQVVAGFTNSQEFIDLCTRFGITANKPDPKGKRLVALTFDDGPCQNTGNLLNTLQQYGAKATFFTNGVNGGYGTAYNMNIARRIAQEGSQLANHTYSHRTPFSGLSYGSMQSEVTSAEANLYSAMGGAYRYFVRIPGGDRSGSILSAVNAPIILWDVDTNDWKYRNADTVYNNAIGSIQDGSIVLMHDIHPTSVQAAQRLIPALKARGYELVTVAELFRRKGIDAQNHTLYTSAVGRATVANAYLNPYIVSGNAGLGNSRAVTVLGEAGLTFYYTTDGSVPNLGSRRVSGTFHVPAGTTVKVVGIDKNGTRTAVTEKTV